jgi:hypothetical protein
MLSASVLTDARHQWLLRVREMYPGQFELVLFALFFQFATMFNDIRQVLNGAWAYFVNGVL